MAFQVCVKDKSPYRSVLFSRADPRDARSATKGQIWKGGSPDPTVFENRARWPGSLRGPGLPISLALVCQGGESSQIAHNKLVGIDFAGPDPYYKVLTSGKCSRALGKAIACTIEEKSQHLK